MVAGEDALGQHNSALGWREIIFPYGREYVTVEEIPGLLAVARYPEAEDNVEMTVSYLIKTTSGKPHGAPLDDEDWDSLRKVWCDLSPYAAGMSQQEWLKYESVFRAADGKPDWQPEPV
jgi:hypothetical protein